MAEAKNFDPAVLHTSTPSFASDARAIAALKAANPALKAGLIGAKPAVDAEGSVKAAPIVDFAARNEFDFTIKEIADGKDWKTIRGLSFTFTDLPRAEAIARELGKLSVVCGPATPRPMCRAPR